MDEIDTIHKELGDIKIRLDRIESDFEKMVNLIDKVVVSIELLVHPYGYH